MRLPSLRESAIEELQICVCCLPGDPVERCLDSLQAAAWTDAVRLFLAPGAVVPRKYSHLPITCLPEGLSWAARDLMVVSEMLMRAPAAAAYLFARADVALGRPDLRQELERMSRRAEVPKMMLLERGDDDSEADWAQLVVCPRRVPKAFLLAKKSARDLLATQAVLSAAPVRRTSSTSFGDSLQGWAFAAGVPVYAPREAYFRPADRTASAATEEPRPIRVHGTDLSIIVPTWNCGPYLGPCLRSLLDQSVDAEVIVVDDASDDETNEVLSAFADRVRVLRHEERRGANAARNTGLRSATGDFLVMADADNQYSPNWLEKLLEAVLSAPEIGLAYCGFSRLAEDGDKRGFASHPWDPRTLWYDNYIDMPSLVRRAALPKGGLVEGFRPFDDWRLWLDMAVRGWKGKLVRENLYIKRVRKDSKTLRSKSLPSSRAREIAAIRREFASLVGLDAPVSVVIPAHGCEDLTVRCLTHLGDYAGVPFVVHYVDNGSPISALDAIAQAAERGCVPLRILRNSENVGFTQAVNQGIEASGDANVLVLNNDCFVGPNCLENLAYEMMAQEQVAAIGPVTCDRGGQSLKIPTHRVEAGVHEGILDQLSDPVSTAAMLRRRHKTAEREVLAFFCTLLNREALRRFGALDDRFPSGLAADDEWCLRVRGHGWKTLLSYGSYAAHLHRSTFERFGIDRDALQRESKQVLRQVLGEDEETGI